MWSIGWITFAFSHHAVGFDFEGTLWNSGLAIREGHSPYPAPTVDEVDVNNPALYPPLLPVAIVPLTLLPWSMGVAVWIVVLAVAVGLSL